MIQHLPAEAPTVYRVTVLDLKRGRVYPVFGPYKSPPERMPGIRLQQVISPNADQLYTLYSSARPGYAPHHAPVPNDATVSFVHVLSLQEGWAHCVGLPEELWDRPASEQAMATSPNGRLLYIVDATLGLVTVMDTASLEIRTAPIDLAVPGVRHTSAVVSADGSALFVGDVGRALGGHEDRHGHLRGPPHVGDRRRVRARALGRRGAPVRRVRRPGRGHGRDERLRAGRRRGREPRPDRTGERGPGVLRLGAAPSRRVVQDGRMRLPVMPPVAPMLAKSVKEIPEGPFAYEPKWDGFRSIVFRDGDEVEIGSRNERPMTRYFPEVVEAIKAEPARARASSTARSWSPTPSCTGSSSRRSSSGSTPPTAASGCWPRPRRRTFIAFDLLALGDDDLTRRPFAERRAALEAGAGGREPADPRHAGHEGRGGRASGGSRSSRAPGSTGWSPSRSRGPTSRTSG